jgi:putative flippase GtrA
LSSKVVFQYVQQLWRLCSTSRHLSVRVLKSTLVGGIGVFINLAVMTLLLGLTNVHDWRASAIASLAANVHNYIAINSRTFADSSHKEFRRLDGYLSYLLVCAAGLAVTAGSYAGLVWGIAPTSFLQGGTAAHVFLIRLSCQFVAVLLGVWFNYALNKVFTARSSPASIWRLGNRPQFFVD